jgi:hypothetical protein
MHRASLSGWPCLYGQDFFPPLHDRCVVCSLNQSNDGLAAQQLESELLYKNGRVPHRDARREGSQFPFLDEF